MGYFVGIDLHGDNNYIGILDEEDRKVFKRKNRNDINEVKNVTVFEIGDILSLTKAF